MFYKDCGTNFHIHDKNFTSTVIFLCLFYNVESCQRKIWEEQIHMYIKLKIYAELIYLYAH